MKSRIVIFVIGLVFGTLLGAFGGNFFGNRYVVRGTWPRAIRMDRWTGDTWIMKPGVRGSVWQPVGSESIHETPLRTDFIPLEESGDQ